MESESLSRNHRVALNIKWSILLRAASIGLSLLLVPVMLDYLGQAHYGIWLTITSFLGWSALLDMGVGNGLKNRLGEALAREDHTMLKAYTTSAYGILGGVSLLALLVFSLLTVVLDWPTLLGASGVPTGVLTAALWLFFLFFCAKIVLNQVLTIAAAGQQTRLSDVVNLLINLFTLLSLLAVANVSGDRLIIVSIICGAVPVLILIGVSLWAFRGPYADFAPKRSLFSMSKAKDVLGLGGRFFVIQLAGIVLFSTDNLIISHYIGPESVTPYHISFRYFGLVVTLFSILITPIWPAYTEAYERGDTDWIQRITQRLIKVWVALTVGVICMWIVAPRVYGLWVGEEVEIAGILNAMMALYVVTITWGSIFVTFINATGKLRIQLYCSIAAGIINIPLSILFIEGTDLGAAGVILATILCLSYGPLLSVIQYRKLVSGSAKGIWNR